MPLSVKDRWANVARPAGLHPVLLERHGAFAGSRLVHGDHDVVLGAAARVQPGVELAPVTGTAQSTSSGLIELHYAVQPRDARSVCPDLRR
jgi:hypothetical protein